MNTPLNMATSALAVRGGRGQGPGYSPIWYGLDDLLQQYELAM
jgi:hypothetical protein